MCTLSSAGAPLKRVFSFLVGLSGSSSGSVLSCCFTASTKPASSGISTWNSLRSLASYLSKAFWFLALIAFFSSETVAFERISIEKASSSPTTMQKISQDGVALCHCRVYYRCVCCVRHLVGTKCCGHVFHVVGCTRFVKIYVARMRGHLQGWRRRGKFAPCGYVCGEGGLVALDDV